MTQSYTIFVHVRATHLWLGLTRAQRQQESVQTIGKILEKYPEVRLRYFDVEAFSAPTSDILMFETQHLEKYSHVIDALRDTDFFAKPYFEVVNIFPSLEDGYVGYEKHLESE